MINLFSRVGLAAVRFRSKRAEYYEYLADLMSASQGDRNLLDMFNADAQRYGNSPRGILSAYWSQRYDETGADLAATWQGTLPDSDLMVIRVAQSSGGVAMEQALRDMARVTTVVERARTEFISTIAVGLLGLSLALGMLAALPMFLVPSLKSAFSFVPLAKWGPAGQSLLALSDAVAAHWLPALVTVIAGVSWVAWSLPNFVHPVRRWMDEHIALYRLYRDFRGALFMATIASMVRKRTSASGLRLNDALGEMAQAAEPWLRNHCLRIIENIDHSGGQGPEVFDTGVLDREVLYFLMDLVESKGFDEGLQRAGARTEKRAATVVASRAAILRWVMLLASLATVGSVLAWTVSVNYEMKQIMLTVLR